MFWRRSRKAEDAHGAQDGEDDLAKLQRQFGIKTVSDKDVEADFLKLLGATGNRGAATNALGFSPRSELALFGETGTSGGGESDEEAQILRQLNLGGDLDSIDPDALSGDEDDDTDDEEAKLAKRELRSVLGDVHREAKRNADKQDPLKAAASPSSREVTNQAGEQAMRERIRAMKIQAVGLKREGNVQQALAVFREVKTLEAQLASGANSTLVATASMTSTATITTTTSNGSAVASGQQHTVKAVSYAASDDPDAKDVDVTDEDMENPEYLAQLAALGLPVTKPMKSEEPAEAVETLERAIRESKERAVQFKRSDRIADALAEMRKMKEMELRLATLKGSEPASSAAPVGPSFASSAVVPPSAIFPPLPEAAHDSDVDVTDEDMNDPAFAAELQKLGFDPTGMSDDEQAEESHDEVTLSLRPVVHPAVHTPAKAHDYSKRFSSMDESDLIDEFEDDDDSKLGDDDRNANEREDEKKADALAETTVSVDLSGPVVSDASEVASVSVDRPASAIVANEQEHSEFREPSNGASIEDLQVQLEKTKASAVQLKRQGNIQAALDMMRRMKQIENFIEMKRRQVVPTISPEELERKQRFGELEALLVNYANDATREAKEQLAVNRAKAAEWLARRKEYSAHLVTLREKRQVRGQEPPTYHIEQHMEQIEVENNDVPLDEMHMRIESINDLSQAAGKEVFIKFNLSFPSSSPHEGKTGGVRISSAPPFSGRITSENDFRAKVQRGRGMQRLFEIKKATFEVWRPGSLLRNPELVARGYQELAPLLSTSELKVRIVFVGPNRKPVGGDVEVSLRLRTPLREKEFKTLTTAVLHVGDYPPPRMPTVTRPTAHSNPVSPINARQTRPHSQSEVPALRGDTQPQLTHTLSAPTMHAEAAPPPAPAPASSGAPEDPHDLDLIISYDVINDEIERIEAALPSLQGETVAEYSDRLDALGLKKQILEIEMQTGKLTLDMYIARLKQRILDDRAIIKQLMRSGRKPDAARVLHRVKIMEKELQGADDQEGGEEEQ